MRQVIILGNSCGAGQVFDPNATYAGIKGQCVPAGTLSTTGVKGLQLALKELAASGVPAADPGTADGIMGPKTRNAVLATIPLIPKLGGDVKLSLEAAAAAAAFSSSLMASLDQLIVNNANVLIAGVRVLLIARAGTGTTTTTTTSALTMNSFFSPPVGAPWYKTWWGAGGAAAAVGLGSYLFFKR